jgi:uncharacterized protein YidB (DUF937 family)
MSQNQGFDLGGLLGSLLGGNKSAAAPAAGGSSGGLGGLGSIAKFMPILMALLASGGLQKIIGQLTSGGLGKQASSWVDPSAANMPVTGDQLTEALGPETVANFAAQAGMSQEDAAKALADALPTVVNAMTPQGEVPQHVDAPDASTMQAQINKLLGGAAQ